MKKNFCFPCTAAGVFLLAGAGHFIRAIFRWDLYINGWYVPFSVSWIVTAVLIGMAVWGVRSVQH